eukprot:scaffold3082_cov119-Isochrysis_galbana.AAC.6
MGRSRQSGGRPSAKPESTAGCCPTDRQTARWPPAGGGSRCPARRVGGPARASCAAPPGASRSP